MKNHQLSVQRKHYYLGEEIHEAKIVKTQLKVLAPTQDPSNLVFIDEEKKLSEASKISKLDNVKYYISLILGILCIVNVFVFLFLLPFVIEPAISTMSYR